MPFAVASVIAPKAIQPVLAHREAIIAKIAAQGVE
jgi:hypothetical protein